METHICTYISLKKEGLNELPRCCFITSRNSRVDCNHACRAEGKVIESRIDHGRGVVATIIVERGTLRTGDPYVAGIYAGRVRAIFNDRGQNR